jgi:hypothetical protein
MLSRKGHASCATNATLRRDFNHRVNAAMEDSGFVSATLSLIRSAKSHRERVQQDSSFSILIEVVAWKSSGFDYCGSHTAIAICQKAPMLYPSRIRERLSL